VQGAPPRHGRHSRDGPGSDHGLTNVFQYKKRKEVILSTA
jgi:hypothetical protein